MTFNDECPRSNCSTNSPGPDASTLHTVMLPSSGEPQLQLRLFASELWLRGETPVTQPHIEGDDVLCWNGEVCSMSLSLASYERLMSFRFGFLQRCLLGLM